MTAFKAAVSACVLVGLLAAAADAVDIATVAVGDPGNAADKRYSSTGYGAVAYTYNIGKYEVTAGQYAAFLNAVGGVDTYRLYNTQMANTSPGSGIARSGGGTVNSPYSYSVAADFVDRPVAFVSYWDACRFTNWLHNGQPTGAQGAGTTETGAYTLDGYNGDDGRIIQRNGNWKWAVTSENEWYKPAYYSPATSSYHQYPTSSSTSPGRDLTDPLGNNANYWTPSGPYPIDSGKYTTVIGQFQNSASPYGTFDQGGNVIEWNEAVIRPDATSASRGVRGGSFIGIVAAMGASNRVNYYPTSEGYDTGFRVVQVPEPCSALMVVIGALGVASRRRRR